MTLALELIRSIAHHDEDGAVADNVFTTIAKNEDGNQIAKLSET